MSAGREFQVDGAATEKREFGVYARNDEHQKSAESEVVHGSVPARWDTLEWLWSAPCESVQPVYRWPAASPEASVASEAAAWRPCNPGCGRRLGPGCSGRAIVSFSDTIRRAQFCIIGYFGFRFITYTIKFCSLLFVHAGCDKQDSLMRGGLCGKLTSMLTDRRNCWSHSTSRRSESHILVENCDTHLSGGSPPEYCHGVW